MSIIDEAMKLSKEEKVKLYFALQSDLQYDENILQEDELTQEQWSELHRREKRMEEENSHTTSENDLKIFLKNRRQDGF